MKTSVNHNELKSKGRSCWFPLRECRNLGKPSQKSSKCNWDYRMADPRTSTKQRVRLRGEIPAPTHLLSQVPWARRVPGNSTQKLDQEQNNKTKELPSRSGQNPKLPDKEHQELLILAWNSRFTATKGCSTDQCHIANSFCPSARMYGNWEQVFRNFYSNLISVQHFNLILQKCQSAKNWKL